MVAGRDPPGRLLGHCGLDWHRPPGSRLRRAQRRRPQGQRARQDPDYGCRPRRHALCRRVSEQGRRKCALRRARPRPACGWSMTKPAWCRKPNPSCGRRSGMSSCDARRQRAAARHQGQADGGRNAPRSTASNWSTRWCSRAARRQTSMPPRGLLLDQLAKLKDGKVTISDTWRFGCPAWRASLAARGDAGRAQESPRRFQGHHQRRSRRRPISSGPTSIRSRSTLDAVGLLPDNTMHAAIVAGSRGGNSSARRWVDNRKGSVGAPAGFSAAPGSGARRVVAAVDRHAGGIGPRGKTLRRRTILRCWRRNPRRAGQGFSERFSVQARRISVKPAAAPVDPTVCQQLFSDCSRKGKDPLRAGGATLIRISSRCWIA